MAIMVAGGLTFAIPGADPVFAEVSTSNPHLYVSAEGQDPDNMFAEGNIIEVIIRDDTIGDTDEGEAEPEVTVNGADLRMLQTANGYWTAYFAEVDTLRAFNEDSNGNDLTDGLDYGVYCTETQASTVTMLELSDGKGIYLPPGSNCANNSTTANGHPLIREPRSLTDWEPSGDTIGQLGLSNADLWPFIQVFDFTPLSDVDIVYNRGGDRQTVTLTFDDPSESHTLDRQKYPQRAHVHIALTDYALNIDPTDEDTWVFDTQNGAAYYNVFDEDGNPVNAASPVMVGSEAGIDETVSIIRGAQGSDVIDCQVTKDFGIQNENDASQDYLISDEDSNGACMPNADMLGDGASEIFAPGNFAIGFVEDGSNNNVFINWAEDQRSNVVVKDMAPRGNSFEVDYSSPGAKSGVIGHFFAELALDVPDDTWNSGERIPITLTDGDANVNPLAEDDLTVANPYSLLVPAIQIGSPVTLRSADGDVVWYDLTDPPPPDMTRPTLSMSDHELQVQRGDTTFTLPRVTCTDDGTTRTIAPSGTLDVNRPIGDRQPITYTCTDPDNVNVNDREVITTITVVIVAEVTNNPPTFDTLPTDSPIAGQLYDLLAGVTCTDIEDAVDPEPKIIDYDGFDEASPRPGTYTITYRCTDADTPPLSTDMPRLIIVEARQATISPTVTPGQWDNGVLELAISGTTTNIDDGDLTVTSDTIPNFGEHDVSVTSNVISGEIIFVNVTVFGSHTFNVMSSDGSEGSDKANIPRALTLSSVTPRGEWFIDTDNVVKLEVVVRGTESVDGIVDLAILNDDDMLSVVAAGIDLGDNNEARVNITSSDIAGNAATFVLRNLYAGADATSNPVSITNIPELLVLSDVIIHEEWAEGTQGSLTINVTGTKASAVITDTSINVQVFQNGAYALLGSGTVEATDDAISFQVTTTDISLSGDTQFRLAIGSVGSEAFTSDSVNRDIPTALTLGSLTLAGTWSGDRTDASTLTLTLRVTGSEGVSGTSVDLFVDGADSNVDVTSSADGTIGTTVSFGDITKSGSTLFQLRSGTGPVATSQNMTVNIPPILTLTSVATSGTWENGEIDLRIAGKALSTESLSLTAPDITGFTAIPITTTGSDSIVDEQGVISGTVSLTNVAVSGATKFQLTAGDGSTDAASQNVTVNIPPVLTLTSVTPGSWTGSTTSDTINLLVEGTSGLPAGTDLNLRWDNDGTYVPLTPIIDVANDGSIFGSVSFGTTTAANSSQVFNLLSVADSAGNSATSNNVTQALPALPASGSSVDMIPTPISSSSSGFPPITRAVINDISAIPAVHNVAVKAIPDDKTMVYTWSSDDKEVESYSDRLRLYEPDAMQLDAAVTGESAVVVNGWELPEFRDGVTTLFNWNVESLAEHADVNGVYIANSTHKLLLSEDASGLMHLGADMQAYIENMGTGDAMLIVILDGDVSRLCSDITLVADFFTFGQTPDGERVNNAIYRIEVEESSSNSDMYEGTVEYTMLNQLNIDDPNTYTGLRTISDEVSIIVHEDFTDEDSIRVNYLDLGADGVSTQIAIQQAAPTHSGVVSFDSESYKVADTVTITLEDADLNVDNDVIDIYTFTPGLDTIGNSTAGTLLLDVTFDDEAWTGGCGVDDGVDDGFAATGFTLQETASSSGVFTGDFQIPTQYCQGGATGTAVSVTGVDIEVNYQDFRDASGEEIEVGAGAAVRANTGTVSLDRTVYPVPFAAGVFETADTYDIDVDVDGDGSIDYKRGDSFSLGQHNLTVHVTIDDADFDISAAGEDVIENATEYLTVKVTRGSASYPINLTDARILETAPDSGAFELDLPIAYNMGPDGQILQGDILQVEYEDPTDASGEPNTVTDSATFDLRNGVLQSDKSVYIIGSDMILTLIEPDFDLENDGAESYPLDLIEWDSDAATLGMGCDRENQENEHRVSTGQSRVDCTTPLAFDPEPSALRETGDSTGIFQVIVEIPAEIDGDRLERGEEIELEYVDYGPSGSDYVGDESEDVTLTVFTSNFGATIELDQKVYTWTDKVYITIVAPDHNFDSALVDEIGDSNLDPIQVSTRSADIDNYKLVETGPDTGIFTGEVILVGFDHNADGDTETGTEAGYDNPQRDTSPDRTGPTNGYLETRDDDGITVSFEYSEDETVVGSALIRWNIGEVQWLESSYPASGTGVVRVIDPDMNWDPEAVNNFVVDVWSDADSGGIDLTITETNEATGIFEGTVFFTITDESSGHRLRVAEGNTVTAEYEDNTLPDPYTTADELDISATTLIGTIVPPLERAPATNLRIVDAFGNSLDAVSADQQVQIVADLANGQDRSQAFAYLVQVQDSNGVTVALSWISGTLEAGQSLSPSTSWIPSDAGTYTATAFVWESVDNPTALSPPVTTDITVS